MRSLALIFVLFAAPLAAQWQILDAHTTSDLRGIDNVGGGVVWASGSDGTILRTEDAGFVWQLCAKPPGGEHLDFRAIQAFDNNTAIAMSSGKGDQSRLYKTTDGCQTWKLLFTNPDPDGFWDGIQLMRPNKVIAESGAILIGDPVNGIFSLFRSVDGGSTWKRWGGKQSAFGAEDNERQAKAKPGESLFAASNQALALWTPDRFLFVTGGPSGARLLYADERGVCQELGGTCSIAFSQFPLSGIAAGISAGASAIASQGVTGYFPLRLMVVGGDYKKPDDSAGTSLFIQSRDNAHLPFTRYFDVIKPVVPPHGYRSAVAYDADHKIWMTVGPNGTDVSIDDGRNWRALHPNPKFNDAPDADQHWNALSLPFVVGPHGRIGKLKKSALLP